MSAATKVNMLNKVFQVLKTLEHIRENETTKKKSRVVSTPL